MAMPTFAKIQLCWLGVSLSIPAVCLVILLIGGADPLLLSNVALPGLQISWILALLTPFVFPGGARLELRLTGFVLAWSAIAIVFPLIWDLPWAVLHDWVYGATADDTAKWFFWAYGVADTRFLQSDSLMIILETWSGIIAVVEIMFVRLFLRNRLTRAVQCFTIASCLAFYGCTVFFGSELMDGLAHIDPTPISYVKFFGLNGMWVVVPAIAGTFLMRLTGNPEYDAVATVGELFGRTLRTDADRVAAG